MIVILQLLDVKEYRHRLRVNGIEQSLPGIGVT